MNFIRTFFYSTLVACLIYFVAVLILIDAPVRAEYWVGEMIAIKKDLVKRFAGKRKIIIAGGSATLFAIDAEYASRQLETPVINFGLHAELRLGKILQEAGAVVERNDMLVLALEPPYFDCHEKSSEWHVKNIIGWDHDAWKQMGFWEKAKFISLISPTTFGEMIVADIQRRFFPAQIYDRLITFDQPLVLSKFRAGRRPSTFQYSAYNLDAHGDILQTDGAEFKDIGRDVRTPRHVCAETKNQLVSFVRAMEGKGVRVYFSNTPYIASGVGKDEIRKYEAVFQKELAPVGCFLDKREDLIFDRKYFFNSDLHLNNKGRALRTDLLVSAIGQIGITGSCPSAPST